MTNIKPYVYPKSLLFRSLLQTTTMTAQIQGSVTYLESILTALLLLLISTIFSLWLVSRRVELLHARLLQNNAADMHFDSRQRRYRAGFLAGMTRGYIEGTLDRIHQELDVVRNVLHDVRRTMDIIRSLIPFEDRRRCGQSPQQPSQQHDQFSSSSDSPSTTHRMNARVETNLDTSTSPTVSDITHNRSPQQPLGSDPDVPSFPGLNLYGNQYPSPPPSPPPSPMPVPDYNDPVNDLSPEDGYTLDPTSDAHYWHDHRPTMHRQPIRNIYTRIIVTPLHDGSEGHEDGRHDVEASRNRVQRSRAPKQESGDGINGAGPSKADLPIEHEIRESTRDDEKYMGKGKGKDI